MTERMLRGAGTVLVVLLACVSALGAVVVAAGAQPWTPARAVLAAAIVAVSSARPAWLLSGLAAVPWLFGNRPTTPQYMWLIWATALASLPLLARLALVSRAEAGRVLRGRVGLAVLAYATASLFSLTSLPFDEIAAAAADAGLWGTVTFVASADVLDPLYSLLSVLFLLHVLVIALALAVEVRRHPAFVVPLASALLAGAAGAVVVGLLDFYHLMDLRKLRSFDPYTNPSGLARLQSTFGHSGWFAEYACFTMPAVLVTLLWPLQRLRQVAAGLTLLVLGLVAIVLSYQRGGWLTYLAVLIYVLLAGWWYLARPAGDRQEAHRGAKLWMGPATAALAVIVVSAGLLVTLAALSPAETRPSTSRFAERLRTITQVSDRSAHVLAGLRLGTLLPVLGGGSESFALRYQEEYLRAGGQYYARGYSPLSTMYGSAHNVFAQTFAGKGLVGLGALCWLLIEAAGVALRRIRDARRSEAPPAIQVGARIVLGFTLAFALYGMVQEVFYVAALQVAVFLVVGLAAGLESETRSRRLTPGILAVALAVALGAHLAQAYGVPGRLREAYVDRQLTRAGARLLAPEVDADGHYFQWSGGHALITVPYQASRFAAELRSAAPFGQVVELRFDGRVVDRIALHDHTWRIVRYTMPRGRASEPRRLEIVVTPPWQPGPTLPRRGVMVRRIDWGLPERPDGAFVP